MRLLIERRTEGLGGSPPLYCLFYRIEADYIDRGVLSTVLAALWTQALKDLQLDEHQLIDTGYNQKFPNVREAQARERQLRDMFEDLRAYLIDARAYGGKDAIEINTNASAKKP